MCIEHLFPHVHIFGTCTCLNPDAKAAFGVQIPSPPLLWASEERVLVLVLVCARSPSKVGDAPG